MLEKFVAVMLGFSVPYLVYLTIGQPFDLVAITALILILLKRRYQKSGLYR